jgi:hypothetical protein
MAYISQTIVFILAILGTLSKSTKTDDTGKPIPSKFGLPILTTAGKVVVTLLALSFVLSIYTTWVRSSAEKHKNEELRQSFKKLEEQNTTLQQQLNKATQPIGKFFISFAAIVPMQDPPLASYSRRLKDDIQRFVNLEYEKSPLDTHWKSEVLDSFVEIGKRSSMLPRERDENTAFNLLNGVKLTIFIYKNPHSAEDLESENYTPDYKLSVSTSIVLVEDAAGDEQVDKMKMYYNVDVGTVNIAAFDVPISENAIYRNDRINSLVDLVGCQAVVLLTPLRRPSDLLDSDFDKIFRQIRLTYFKVNVAGRQLSCNEPKRHENQGTNEFPFYTCIVGSQQSE